MAYTFTQLYDTLCYCVFEFSRRINGTIACESDIFDSWRIGVERNSSFSSTLKPAVNESWT